jgi:hypothetical protein
MVRGLSRARPRWLDLGALAVASLVVYWLGLLLPYRLHIPEFRVLRDIGRLTRDDPLAQAGFVLTLGVLSGLYYLAWRACRGHQPKSAWAVMAAGLVLINLSMMWLYPIGAADIFDNIMRGRITAVYGGNPFYDLPIDFPRDRFYFFTAWRYAPTAYGPLWEALAAGASGLSGDDRLANILGFKALGLIFYAGSVALLAVILRRHAPDRALQGVCLFAWNPLVIYETAGNGHNDIVMVFFILLAMAATFERRFAWAAVALTAGGLIKFASFLLLPIALGAGLHALAGRPRARQIWFVVGTLAACAALAVVAYAPFGRGGDVLSLQRRSRMFTASLPAVAQAQLEAPLGIADSRRVVGLAALAATAVAVGLQARLVWQGRRNPLQAATFVLLFYLLLTCLWFQPWYVLWPLALAALLPEGALGRTAVLLSYAVLWRTIIFDFFVYRGGPLPPRTWRETLLGPAMLGVVWSYAVFYIVRRRMGARPLGPAWRSTLAAILPPLRRTSN